MTVRLPRTPGADVLPPRIAEAFRTFPTDLAAVCRPHPWAELTSAPGDGLRSVRDTLVPLMDNDNDPQQSNRA